MKVTIDVRKNPSIEDLILAYAKATGAKYLYTEELDEECICKLNSKESCMYNEMFNCRLSKTVHPYFKNHPKIKELEARTTKELESSNCEED